MLTGYRKIRHIFQCPGQVEQPENAQCNNCPNKGAGRAACNGVETYCPREDMARHTEDLKDGLGPA